MRIGALFILLTLSLSTFAAFKNKGGKNAVGNNTSFAPIFQIGSAVAKTADYRSAGVNVGFRVPIKNFKSSRLTVGNSINFNKVNTIVASPMCIVNNNFANLNKQNAVSTVASISYEKIINNKISIAAMLNAQVAIAQEKYNTEYVVKNTFSKPALSLGVQPTVRLFKVRNKSVNAFIRADVGLQKQDNAWKQFIPLTLWHLGISIGE